MNAVPLFTIFHSHYIINCQRFLALLFCGLRCVSGNKQKSFAQVLLCILAEHLLMTSVLLYPQKSPKADSLGKAFLHINVSGSQTRLKSELNFIISLRLVCAAILSLLRLWKTDYNRTMCRPWVLESSNQGVF